MVNLWRFRRRAGRHRPHGCGPGSVRDDGTQV